MNKKRSFVRNAVFVLLFSYLLQFIQVDIGLSNIKIYMVLSFLLFFYVVKDGKLATKFLVHEKIWMLSYLLIAFSILYAQDVSLAVQLVLGEIVLVLSFVVLRALMQKLSIDVLESIMLKAGKYFVWISIMLFVAGIISYYILKIVPPQTNYLNDHSIRVYGVYLEGYLPRFMGLCASPNNYSYYGILFFWLFIYKNKTKLAMITLLTLVLSLSAIVIIIIIIQTIIYLNHKKFKYLPLVIVIFVLLVGAGLYLQNSYSFINQIITDRTSRNETGSGRFELWAYCLGLIQQSPIWGYGANQSRVIIASFRDLNSSHNSYIEMFLTIGIFGFVIYLLFVAAMFNYSRKLNRYYKTPLFTILTIILILGGLSNNMLHIEYVVFYLAIIGIYRIDGNSNRLSKISALTN